MIRELVLALVQLRAEEVCITIRPVSSPDVVNRTYRKCTHRWNNLWHPAPSFRFRERCVPGTGSGSWCHQKDIALLWNQQVCSKFSNKNKKQNKQEHLCSCCWRMLHSLYMNVTILLSLTTFPEDIVRSEAPKLARGQKWKLSTASLKQLLCSEPYMGESNNCNRKQKKKGKPFLYLT